MTSLKQHNISAMQLWMITEAVASDFSTTALTQTEEMIERYISCMNQIEDNTLTPDEVHDLTVELDGILEWWIEL